MSDLYSHGQLDKTIDDHNKSCEAVIPKAAGALKLLQNNIQPNKFLIKKQLSPLEILNNQVNASILSLQPNKKVIDHCVPSLDMGDYMSVISKQQHFRNALEDEDEALQRERTLFGNPYKKVKKSKDSSQDSVMMNEAEEEGSHGFDVETTTSVQVTAKRRRINRALLDRYPKLGSLGAIIVPDFKLMKFDFDLSDYESKKQHLLERGIINVNNKELVKSLTTILDEDAEMDESTTMTQNSIEVIEQEFKMSWLDFEQTFYTLISAFPKSLNY